MFSHCPSHKPVGLFFAQFVKKETPYRYKRRYEPSGRIKLIKLNIYLGAFFFLKSLIKWSDLALDTFYKPAYKLAITG